MKQDALEKSRVLKFRQSNWLKPLNLSRSHFIQALSAIGLSMQLPLLGFRKASAQDVIPKINAAGIELSDKEMYIISTIQDILLPVEGEGPGAREIKADTYLQWVLKDPDMDPEDSKYIIDGIRWTDESAEEIFGLPYTELSADQRMILVNRIIEDGWGDSWLSMLVNYLMEALMADPIYGGNPDEKAWKWLGHYPGYPRPKRKTAYWEIRKTIGEEI